MLSSNDKENGEYCINNSFGFTGEDIPKWAEVIGNLLLLLVFKEGDTEKTFIQCFVADGTLSVPRKKRDMNVMWKPQYCIVYLLLL